MHTCIYVFVYIYIYIYIYISNTVRTANYFLYNIGKVRSKLTFNLTKSLLHSLVFSRLRYCNSLFINIPQKLMNKFDSIQIYVR